MELNSRFLHKLLSWFTFLTLTDKESIFILKKLSVFLWRTFYFLLYEACLEILDSTEIQIALVLHPINGLFCRGRTVRSDFG